MPNLSDFVETTQETPESAPTAPKAKNIGDAFSRVTAGEVTPTAEDVAALGGAPAPAPTAVDDIDPEDEVPPEPEGDIPSWVKLPPNFKTKPGRTLYFVRFRAEWTDAAHKGERQCILWNLTDTDEKFAYKRMRGDAARVLDELTKGMIRVVDGEFVDWSRGHSSNVERFWAEIGSKCRKQLNAIYSKSHSLTDKERADFFGNCLVVASSAG